MGATASGKRVHFAPLPPTHNPSRNDHRRREEIRSNDSSNSSISKSSSTKTVRFAALPPPHRAEPLFRQDERKKEKKVVRFNIPPEEKKAVRFVDETSKRSRESEKARDRAREKEREQEKEKERERQRQREKEKEKLKKSVRFDPRPQHIPPPPPSTTNSSSSSTPSLCSTCSASISSRSASSSPSSSCSTCSPSSSRRRDNQKARRPSLCDRATQLAAAVTGASLVLAHGHSSRKDEERRREKERDMRERERECGEARARERQREKEKEKRNAVLRAKEKMQPVSARLAPARLSQAHALAYRPSASDGKGRYELMTTHRTEMIGGRELKSVRSVLKHWE